MDNLEMVEKLVEKTGVCYADAKEALESSEWDLLDAVIYLEKAGKTEKKSGTYTTVEQKRFTEESPEIKVDPMDVQQPGEDNKKYYYQGEQKKSESKTNKVLHKIKRFLLDNKLVARNNDGREVFTIPVVIALIVFIAAFHIAIILLILSLIMGYHYSFIGPNLGKESVNRAAESVGDMVNEFGNDIREKRENKKEEQKNNNQ